MKFDLKIKFANGEFDNWIYDTLDNEIISSKFGPINPNIQNIFPNLPDYNFGDKVIKPIDDIKYLEINFGFKCNLDCEYCPQLNLRDKFYSSSPKDVDPFIERLKKSNLKPKYIRFWGGEPLVYWKTMKILVPKVREIFPEAYFSLSTNGYLLDKEKIDFLTHYNFSILLSDDGCPESEEDFRKSFFGDPNKRKTVEYALERFKDKLAFQCTINPNSPNIQKKVDYFNKQFPQFKDYKILSLPFKFNGYNLLHRDKFVFTDEILKETAVGTYSGFTKSLDKMHLMTSKFSIFEERIIRRENVQSVKYYCNNPYYGLVTDLQGNIFNCHFRYQKTGTLENINEIPATNMKTWKYRKPCPTCPFIQLCGGGCTTQSDEEHELSCINSRYPYNFGVFKAVFKKLFNVEVIEITSHFK